MIARGLQGVEFLVCNTDAQHLRTTLTENRVQMGPELTGGLGCGANPDVGCVFALLVLAKRLASSYECGVVDDDGVYAVVKQRKQRLTRSWSV